MTTNEEKEIIGIKPFKTKFSRYALSLDRIFKHASLENLQLRLTSPRAHHKPYDVKVFKNNQKFHFTELNEKQQKVNFTIEDKKALKALRNNHNTKLKPFNKKLPDFDDLHTEPTFKDLLRMNREEK